MKYRVTFIPAYPAAYTESKCLDASLAFSATTPEAAREMARKWQGGKEGELELVCLEPLPMSQQ